jgi:hypothetical protein
LLALLTIASSLVASSERTNLLGPGNQDRLSWSSFDLAQWCITYSTRYAFQRNSLCSQLGFAKHSHFRRVEVQVSIIACRCRKSASNRMHGLWPWKMEAGSRPRQTSHLVCTHQVRSKVNLRRSAKHIVIATGALTLSLCAYSCYIH